MKYMKDEMTLLREFYLRHKSVLERMASYLMMTKKIVQTVESAADIVCDTFLSYLRTYAIDKPYEEQVKLLVRILGNKIKDIRKRARYRHECYSYEAGEADGRISAYLEAHGRVQASPEEIYIRRESYRELLLMIERLPKIWRDVIELHVLEDRSIHETCQILDISGTVCRSRLSRARKHLRCQIRAAENV